MPARYDLVNRVLTFRFDERWRSRAARVISSGEPKRVLDVGCGTGDLVLHLARRLPGRAEIVGLDFSEPMLEVARRRVVKAELGDRVSLVCSDSSNLSFPDAGFDAVGLAFSFRNMVWRNPLRDRCLAEMHRVLRPGGRIVIVESSQPGSVFLRFWYHAYLKVVVPRVGGLLSGENGAYRYLSESMRLFHDPEEISELLRSAGFRKVSHEPLLGGMAALHVGERNKTKE